MNLRHIDPRSTDWMDAMLEGDLEAGQHRQGKREREADQQAAGEHGVGTLELALGASSGSELHAARPPGR